MHDTLVTLATELKHANEHLARHERKIDKIKSIPGQRMQQIVTAIGYCLPAISSFAGSSFSFGGGAAMLLDGSVVAFPGITVTGTEIMATIEHGTSNTKMPHEKQDITPRILQLEMRYSKFISILEKII